MKAQIERGKPEKLGMDASSKAARVESAPPSECPVTRMLLHEGQPAMAAFTELNTYTW